VEEEGWGSTRLDHADISDPNKYKPMPKSSLSLKVELGAAPVTTLGVVLDLRVALETEPLGDRAAR
jgi:hypothetical protein